VTDSPCGFSTDEFLATLAKYGPELSAHEVAHLAKVSVRQVLCAAHHDDWRIQAVASPISGGAFLYRKRDLTEKAIVRPIRRYMDDHDPMKSGYGRHREVM